MDKIEAQKNAILRNLSELSLEEQKKLNDGLQDVPVKKILDQLQYLQNDILPRVKQNRGTESADYKFYSSLCNSLIWAITIIDRYDFLKNQYCLSKEMEEFLRTKITLLESELQKYTTIEDLTITHTLKIYADRVKKKVQNNINEKQ